jgi:hypothetical protein
MLLIIIKFVYTFIYYRETGRTGLGWWGVGGGGKGVKGNKKGERCSIHDKCRGL